MSRGIGRGIGRGLGTYVRIVAHGPAGRPFTAAVVARLPISMAPLGIVLLVQETTGSYGLAGTVTGAFAFANAVGAPLCGKALDRWGQPRVMVATSVFSAVFLAALAVASIQPLSTPLLCGLSALSGLTFPPMTPAMRAAWRVALREPVQQRAAYALDAVAVETIFIAGPLLLSLLLVVTPPVAPLLVTAGLMVVGGLAYSTTSAARQAHAHALAQLAAEPGAAAPPPRRGRVNWDRLLPPSLVLVLVVSLGMAMAFGAIDTSLAATARDVLGDQAKLGLLFASIAGGSALGGLWFGTRDVSHSTQVRLLPLLLLAFACGFAPIAVVLGGATPTLAVLSPLLFFTGMSISPTLIILQNLVDEAAPAGRTNEGQAWLATSVTTGVGVGTAAAGILVDIAGVPWSFAGAGCAALASAATAGVLRGRHARRVWPSRAAPGPQVTQPSPSAAQGSNPWASERKP
jgi:MFS family permease